MPNRNGYSPSGDEADRNSIPSTPNPIAMPQQEALNLEVSRNSSMNDQKPLDMASKNSHSDVKPKRPDDDMRDLRAAKRFAAEDERLPQRPSINTTHIKITKQQRLEYDIVLSFSDTRSQSDGSLMVTMDVNGVMYQGVLFASPSSNRNRL
ncbi:protein dead ringer [Caerostris extrusa]|uniref:Protein dead ringer n=1 Tax=Caerostris extrusa TaxID=172846 RepID=A0AAV4THC6_CAEEX|nr:protein dead ringer [Caerostris extrusa]